MRPPLPRHGGVFVGLELRKENWTRELDLSSLAVAKVMNKDTGRVVEKKGEGVA